MGQNGIGDLPLYYSPLSTPLDGLSPERPFFVPASGIASDNGDVDIQQEKCGDEQRIITVEQLSQFIAQQHAQFLHQFEQEFQQHTQNLLHAVRQQMQAQSMALSNRLQCFMKEMRGVVGADASDSELKEEDEVRASCTLMSPTSLHTVSTGRFSPANRKKFRGNSLRSSTLTVAGARTFNKNRLGAIEWRRGRLKAAINKSE
ncbi:MAG TPA: hypothetical protein VGT41_06720 [Candidatus Babeliales bacterium]|nr:hypothetical protein [Candidatus Babeliales bacterium]